MSLSGIAPPSTRRCLPNPGLISVSAPVRQGVTVKKQQHDLLDHVCADLEPTANVHRIGFEPANAWAAILHLPVRWRLLLM